jgi:hypothetical protein
VREVRRYANRPSRLRNLVPSVVTPTGHVYPPAYQAFVRDAVADAQLALRLPAAKEIERMISTLDGKDADTKITTLENQRAADYLEEAARDTRPIWPELSRLLRQARDEL